MPASKSRAAVLASGEIFVDNPQFGIIPNTPPVAKVRAAGNGNLVRVGSLAIVAHATPGHTPGGPRGVGLPNELWDERCIGRLERL